MEVQHARNIRVICDLRIGDKVRSDKWGYLLDDKDWIITDVKECKNCSSGFIVKINGYDSYIDSSWVIKQE